MHSFPQCCVPTILEQQLDLHIPIRFVEGAVYKAIIMISRLHG